MPLLIEYLLKVNLALGLFYLAYRLVLRRLTFYSLNRLFLVSGMLFSAGYPFVDLTGLAELLSRHRELTVIPTYGFQPAWAPVVSDPGQTAGFDYWFIPVALFWTGTTRLAVRLLLRLVSLYGIHSASEPAAYQKIKFRKITGSREAFSFWQAIYLNPSGYNTQELGPLLRHE